MNSYLNLKEEVWDKNICSGCGACVSVCPVDNIYFKEDSPIKFICDECACIISPVEEIEYPVSAEFCKVTLYDVPCGACYDACPRTKNKVIPTVKKGIGRVLQSVKAKSKMEVKGAQSGGVVSAILASAFDEGLIDGAIVMMEDKWTMEPQSYLATSKEEVLKSSGSRYNWNVPILRALKDAVMVKKLNKIAIVGTPCVMNAVHQIMASDNDLLKPFKDKIRLKIGLFCFETYNYEKMMEIFEENNINPWDVYKMDIAKGKLIIKLRNNEIIEFKLDKIEEAMRAGCKVCGDFSGIVADISVGNVGAPLNYSTVLIRNEWGAGFFERAVDNGYVEYEEGVDIDAVEKLIKLKKQRVKQLKQ